MGVPFAVFFDDTIVVQNYAKNGRSTRTFKEEGLWDLIETQLRPGDVVFIQFGHNDESEKKVDRYTTPAEYKANLTQMITVTRAKGADPILLSPIVRRHFKEDGTLKQTHPYAELVREVAAETGVTFIDAERITKTYFEGLGDRDSALRFMHIEPNLHPNYPNGIRDNTHTNALGAREVAQLMLRALKEMDHPLVAHLRPVDPKHLKEHY